MQDWVVPLVTGGVGVLGGGFGRHLLELLRARQTTDAAHAQREQGLVATLVDQQIRREQELWHKIGSLEQALANTETRLDKAVADAEAKIDRFREEKNDALGELNDRRIEVLLLQNEVNEELDAQAKPPRYEIKREALRVARLARQYAEDKKATPPTPTTQTAP